MKQNMLLICECHGYYVCQFIHLEYCSLASQNGLAIDVLINHDIIGNLDDAALLDTTSLDSEMSLTPIMAFWHQSR